MELIQDKFDTQVDALVSTETELLNLKNMEDDALVEEIEHLLALVAENPHNTPYEFEIWDIVELFHEQNYLSKFDRKLLEGSYVLGHVNMAIGTDGYIVRMRV